MTHTARLALILPLLALTACGENAMSPMGAPRTPGATVTATTPAAAAAAEAATGVAQGTATAAPGRLGTTIASLGDATQPGMWIRTPLVRTAGKGRLTNPATGKSVNVDLIPLSGPASAGSQVSLPALQGLGADLTDLPEVEVYSI
ncbi:hypothetical protein [Paracoccus luteus]|uniref:hypothetical protein n=1 Tax=Paracoccus luteus TaxID=2508543 RepID=UPI00106F8CDF|nr:hypothetical protein [Paracoccus luteus]